MYNQGNTGNNVSTTNSNFGVKVIPTPNWSHFAAEQIGDAGCIASGIGWNDMLVAHNYYYNDDWTERRMKSGATSLHYQESGAHTFSVAASGEADSTITWTNALTIENDADVRLSDGTLVTSDARLKENIEDVSSKLNDILKLKVRNYNFKSDSYIVGDPSKKRIGFIAQEFQEVFPSLVKEFTYGSAGVRDKANTTTEEKRLSIKQSALTPMLVKSIQEQQIMIEALTARIEQLENNK
jgi:hypothetical protein